MLWRWQTFIDPFPTTSLHHDWNIPLSKGSSQKFELRSWTQRLSSREKPFPPARLDEVWLGTSSNVSYWTIASKYSTLALDGKKLPNRVAWRVPPSADALFLRSITENQENRKIETRYTYTPSWLFPVFLNRLQLLSFTICNICNN